MPNASLYTRTSTEPVGTGKRRIEQIYGGVLTIGGVGEVVVQTNLKSFCGRYTIDSSCDGFYRTHACESVAHVQKSGGSRPNLECLDMPFLITEHCNVTGDGQSSTLAKVTSRCLHPIGRWVSGAIVEDSADTLEIPAIGH